uniref:Large ribosomal subunit protein uL24c n=1 Tax=Synarthrophyton chejuense TaxID=2485825 RepID=A0A3G3MFW8_9FLOR|nr:ribosomal protein L24 [Synarthrophyton chejuense]AYR05723.1 ribosomal protein L24 [Synarthrophyton chejuense]
MKNKNKKHKMHIKNGDVVQIISGNQKGKISTIIKVLPKTSQVIVKDLNLKIKHSKSKNEEESGKITTFEAPIHSSNVMLYSKENKLSSRFSIQYDTNKQKYRSLQKNGEVIK